MINTLSILFSLLAVCFVVIRAAMLDRTLPWFTTPPKPGPAQRPDRTEQARP